MRDSARVGGKDEILARAVSDENQIVRQPIALAMKLGFEALNRGDFKSAFSVYDPQVEMVPAPQLKGLGLGSLYRGLEGRARFQERWHAEWGDFQHVPEEVFDLGEDGIFVSGRLRGVAPVAEPRLTATGLSFLGSPPGESFVSTPGLTMVRRSRPWACESKPHP